jgi:hypothetical protein
MNNWLQRIRGAVGIGLAWAAAWAPVGAITATLLGAGSAAGTLAIAKAARGPALLEGREEMAHPRLK